MPRDVEGNLAALELQAVAAARAGASLLLCPECWLCGYNIGAAVRSLAQPRDGPAAQRVADIARRHGIVIAYGYAERDTAHRDVLFNSVQIFDAAGKPLAHYRKTHLFGPDERAAYHSGDALAAPFAIAGFSVAPMICYDIEFPEMARAAALAGAELLLVPTALAAEYATVRSLLVPARAVENQLFVAYCNHCGEEDGMRFLGGSCLIGPDGTALAAAGQEEALLLATVDRRRQRAAARLFPYRADRRPELYAPVSAAPVRSP